MKKKEIFTKWVEFAKNYAEASADDMDTLEEFYENRLDSFWEEYDIAMGLYIKENNLDIDDELENELKNEFNCESYARHIFSYAVEKGYIKDYDIDYNGKISVEPNEGFYNDMADAIVDYYNKVEDEPVRIPEEYQDEDCIGLMNNIAGDMLFIRQDELDWRGVEIDYDYVWKLARTKQLDTTK